MNSVEAVLASVRSFEREAHALLSRHESGRSRVVTLRRAHRDLSHLSVAQAGLLKQALTCVEHGLHRAACVMAWCAVIDLIIEKLASDNFAKPRHFGRNGTPRRTPTSEKASTSTNSSKRRGS